MRKITILLLLCFCLYSSKAYAVFDFVGKLEDGIELASDIKSQAEEMRNRIAEYKKRLTQGFAALGDCLSNPTKCDVNSLKSLAGDSIAAVTGASDFVSAMKGSALEKGNLPEYESEGLENSVHDTYVFKRGAGKSIERLRKNRKDINGIAINDTNALFAKAITTHHSIMFEDNALYQTEFGKDTDMEEIVRAQTVVSLYTQSRLARILELRANMVGAEVTLELTQQNNSNISDADKDK